MAIGRKPKIEDEDAKFQQFVERAPGAVVEPPKEVKESKQPEPRRKGRRRKEPITLTIAPELLRKVDAAAGEAGMSRAAFVAMSLNYTVTHGIFK